MSSETWMSSDRKYEIVGLLVLAFTVLLFFALVSDGEKGHVNRSLDGMGDVPNAFGKPGALLAGQLCVLFGGASHVIYCLLAVWGAMLFRHRPLDRLGTRVAGMVLTTFGVAGMLHVDFAQFREGSLAGGLVGAFVGDLALRPFGLIGANVVSITIALIGILLSTEFLFVRLFHGIRVVTVLTLGATAHFAAVAFRSMPRLPKRAGGTYEGLGLDEEDRAEIDSLPNDPDEPEPRQRIRIKPSPRLSPDEPAAELPEPEENTAPEPVLRGHESPFDEVPLVDEADKTDLEVPDLFDEGPGEEPEAVCDPSLTPEPVQESLLDDEPAEPSAPASTAPKPKKKPMPRRKTDPMDELPADYVYPKRYTRPPLNLFEAPPQVERPDLSEQLLKTSAFLEQRLGTFGIEARVTDVTRGPSITRFELEPAPGIKVSRFISLADDLALALKAHRVRVEAPIPGKGRVGIEVPNKLVEPVVLRELLESSLFQKAKGGLTLALGKDIAGDVKVADLASMPHLLVAGATGSGKTVCVKTMLASLLANHTPEELQLMLIDPKMVELSIFEGIPHLITPVVTDPKKAASSLSWLITEMEERYRLFAHLRVRNIEVYNDSVENGEIEMAESEDADAESVESIRKLPYIVCIIDELADLMMLARSEVEDAIARLAQLARAVGIHLIIATQRPSVDVLTGVIKSNFPARISFQVSSRVDSRCILDEIGAERLIGKGDMLYLPAGQSKPTRIQGAFVSDDEMDSLIYYLKTQAPPQYRDEIEQFGKSGDVMDELDDEEDDLLDDAIRIVLETGQASISMVQRRLRVGYTRAARLIDMMEMRGIVGPHIGSKAREILVDAPPRDEGQ